MEDSYVLQLLAPKFKEFHLCFCGYAQCNPLHSFGPAARPNYIIHYILDGKGFYQVGDRKYELSKGQGFLIEPETLTFYQADKEEPWTYLWIGFGGTRAGYRLHDIGLNSGQLIFQCSYGNELKQIVLSMLKHTQSTTTNIYFLQGKLYEFFLFFPVTAPWKQPRRFPRKIIISRRQFHSSETITPKESVLRMWPNI